MRTLWAVVVAVKIPPLPAVESAASVRVCHVVQIPAVLRLWNRRLVPIRRIRSTAELNPFATAATLLNAPPLDRLTVSRVPPSRPKA